MAVSRNPQYKIESHLLSLSGWHTIKGLLAFHVTLIAQLQSKADAELVDWGGWLCETLQYNILKSFKYFRSVNKFCVSMRRGFFITNPFTIYFARVKSFTHSSASVDRKNVFNIRKVETCSK